MPKSVSDPTAPLKSLRALRFMALSEEESPFLTIKNLLKSLTISGLVLALSNIKSKVSLNTLGFPGIYDFPWVVKATMTYPKGS